MAWAEEELATIDLGDTRLNQRAITLLESLEQKPSASIPGACQSWGQTQAAYRFLGNDKVDWEAVMSPHWDSTLNRMKKHSVILHIQDTTELNFNGQEIEGLGPLSYEAQRGMYAHVTYAITPEREPLGVTDVWAWAREFKDKDGQRGGICESVRWIEGYERVVEHAQQVPESRHVYIADREADITALFHKAQQSDFAVDLLIRNKHNRALPEGVKLWDKVKDSPLLGTITFTLPKGRGRKARKVTQEIRTSRVAISNGKRGKIDVTCVLAEEINAPKGSKPVVWRLLTNRIADTRDAALELIQWYLARWEIEMFFLILKEGCRVEKLQLSKMDRIETALSMYMIIAWRINWLMRLGRNVPDMDASAVFDEEEWKSAYILNKIPPPAQAPRLNEVIRLIAKLGGFLGRKRDGEPGVKSLWLGMQQISIFAEGLRYLKQLQTGETCV